MMSVPTQPKIFHITHLRNLEQIARDEGIWSDAKRIERKLNCQLVGMSTIKQRRLEDIDVRCHPGIKVGQCVPFYFCPRSIMLYILHKGNHQDINYTEGQRPMIHMQVDLRETVKQADKSSVKWAFSDCNAGSRVADFFNRLEDLDKVNWSAVKASDFRDPTIKEGKQAEFLVFESLPWTLVEKIGVIDEDIQSQVNDLLKDAAHRPPAIIERGWYY